MTGLVFKLYIFTGVTKSGVLYTVGKVMRIHNFYPMKI